LNPNGIRAIQAMVAHAVLITTAAIVTGGILTMYASVNDRMRAMTRERLGILTAAAGAVLAAGELTPSSRERLGQVDVQLPLLRHRHHLLRNAVPTIFAGIALLVLSVIIIGAAVTSESEAVSTAALALVLAGTGVLLGGLLLVARSIMISSDAVDAEVDRTISLG
jgi:hypothetical protein